MPTEISNGFSSMNLCAVPEHDDVTSEVSQQMPQEVTHLCLADVAGMQLVVESEPLPVWAHRDCRDDRDPVVPVPVADNRSLAPW